MFCPQTLSLNDLLFRPDATQSVIQPPQLAALCHTWVHPYNGISDMFQHVQLRGAVSTHQLKLVQHTLQLYVHCNYQFQAPHLTQTHSTRVTTLQQGTTPVPQHLINTVSCSSLKGWQFPRTMQALLVWVLGATFAVWPRRCLHGHCRTWSGCLHPDQ